MRETRRNLLVGLFVLVGLGALGSLIVLFGQGPTSWLGTQGYQLNIQFQAARGVRPGNQVMIGGIEVGRVANVTFIDPQRFDHGVNVAVIIESDIEIPVGSKALTTEPGIGQGRPPIEIIAGPPGQGMLAAGAVIQGDMRGAIDSIVPQRIVATLEKTASHISEAAAALTPVLEDLHEIMIKRNPAEVDRPGGAQGNMSTAMARFDGTLKHVNEVIGDPATKSQIKEAVANIHAASEDAKLFAADLREASQKAHEVVNEAKELVENTQGTLERVEGEFMAASREARDMFERGSKFLDTANEVVTAIKRGDGTIGRMLQDGKLYESLVLTVERLAKAMEEFQLLIKDWRAGKVRIGL
ncbi:MAG: MlaD family protein [Planctomycetota bacterium]